MRATGTAVERSVPKPIIRGALLRVAQHIIGFVDLNETTLCLGVAGVTVGVMRFRLAAKSLLDFVVARPARYSQNLVVAALFHKDALFA
jgi:hypothetical protein